MKIVFIIYVFYYCTSSIWLGIRFEFYFYFIFFDSNNKTNQLLLLFSHHDILLSFAASILCCIVSFYCLLFLFYLAYMIWIHLSFISLIMLIRHHFKRNVANIQSSIGNTGESQLSRKAWKRICVIYWNGICVFRREAESSEKKNPKQTS